MKSQYNRSIPIVATRIIIFGIVLVFVVFLMGLEAGDANIGETLYQEKSLTESMQIMFLLLSAMLFGIIGYRYEDKRSLSILLVGISLAAFIRELDNFLDHNVFDGAWQTFVLIDILIVGFFTYRLRATLKEAILEFMNHPAFGMVVSGFLVVFVFSRMYGRKSFWKAVMAENYSRSVKNLAEEGIELLGYALIFLGILEFFMYCMKKKNEVV